jgi:Fur family ferric uptake transcriptional regulator
MYTNNDSSIINKLKEHHVHLTQNRIAVFKLLTEKKTALSVSVIMKQSDILLDRISVYRALKHFLQKGLVEIVPNNEGNSKYILASSKKEIVKSRDNRCAYFTCTDCQHTEIIIEPIVVNFDSFTNHQISNYKLIIEGLCTGCM